MSRPDTLFRKKTDIQWCIFFVNAMWENVIRNDVIDEQWGHRQVSSTQGGGETT